MSGAAKAEVWGGLLALLLGLAPVAAVSTGLVNLPAQQDVGRMVRLELFSLSGQLRWILRSSSGSFPPVLFAHGAY